MLQNGCAEDLPIVLYTQVVSGAPSVLVKLLPLWLLSSKKPFLCDDCSADFSDFALVAETMDRCGQIPLKYLYTWFVCVFAGRSIFKNECVNNCST